MYIYAVFGGLLFDVGWGVDGEKIFQIEIRKNWKRIPIVVTLHPERCYFASRWLLFRFASSAELFGSQVSNIFLPRIERVTFCCREFYIPYENQLHSLREYKILSAGNNYFPGLKISYSRQGNASINARNEFKALFMEIQSILNHLIIKAGVKSQRCGT